MPTKLGFDLGLELFVVTDPLLCFQSTPTRVSARTVDLEFELIYARAIFANKEKA